MSAVVVTLNDLIVFGHIGTGTIIRFLSQCIISNGFNCRNGCSHFLRGTRCCRIKCFTNQASVFQCIQIGIAIQNVDIWLADTNQNFSGFIVIRNGSAILISEGIINGTVRLMIQCGVNCAFSRLYRTENQIIILQII